MWQRHRILWTSIACGWLLIAFSFTLNYFLFAPHYVEIFARPPTFGQMLVWEIPYWVLGAMLAPVVFTITRRFPLERKRWLPQAVVHLGAAVLLSMAHRNATGGGGIPAQLIRHRTPSLSGSAARRTRH